MSSNATATEKLRKEAARLLSDGTVGVVIGYGRKEGEELAAPIFVRKAEEAERLVFDERSFGNLAVYLPKDEIRAMGKVGLVVKGCDVKAVNVLLRENVIERDDVFLIGVRCSGVGEPLLHKCTVCDVHDPQGCDLVLGDAVEQTEVDSTQRYVAADEVDAKTSDERWDFWKEHMLKCVRCYACRQVCPLCYCKRCIVEKSQPQWVETSGHLRGNLDWNVVRAFHLTGRCVGCGECERVCPVNIPLGAVNQRMAKLVEEWFDFRSGSSPDETGPFSVYTDTDTDEGIL